MDWLTRLKDMKAISGLTTKEIARLSRVPEPTLEKLFAGKTKDPKLQTIIQVVHFFGHNVDDLLDRQDKVSPYEDAMVQSLSISERELIKKYRTLDAHGKEIVDSNMAIEYKRCATPIVKTEMGNVTLFSGTMVMAANQPESVKDDTNEDEGELFRQYDASAGNGYWADEDNFELIRAKDAPHNAKFCVKLSGDSMEPLYSNGDVVWVDSDALVEENEIGIFVFDNHSYCKKLIRLPSGYYALHSLNTRNPDYEDKIIHEYDDFRCVGKVL